MPLDLRADVHRRLNPLTGQWVIVSPHRTMRPWQGQVEPVAAGEVSAHDPECYMCPGNLRANGERNPDYQSTFVFTNDFPALRPESPLETFSDHELLAATGEPGICRVVCFSPRHDVTLAMMPPAAIRGVIDLWIDELRTIAGTPGIEYVQIFENRGTMMGASNPHPHGQIWATHHLPNEIVEEDEHQVRYFDRHASDLLGDYLSIEQARGERLVCANDHFAALVPFWAIWPFETMVIATRHVSSLDELTGDERQGLADILKRLLTRYDNLFSSPCPYSMGFHMSPVRHADQRHWRLHAHFYPPVLRSATIRKFMVGYEMLGTPQRDLTPEHAAERLRAVSEQHYRDAASES